MTPEEAVRLVETKFPFADYATRSDRQNHFLWVTRETAKVLPKGSSVLDFGAGPGDVSAVLAQTGYHVTAADDLQDTWHLLPGNREKILAFVKEMNVEFEITDRVKPWPWKPGQFDMVMIHHVLEHLADSPRGLLLALLDRPSDGEYWFDGRKLSRCTAIASRYCRTFDDRIPDAADAASSTSIRDSAAAILLVMPSFASDAMMLMRQIQSVSVINWPAPL